MVKEKDFKNIKVGVIIMFNNLFPFNRSTKYGIIGLFW